MNIDGRKTILNLILITHRDSIEIYNRGSTVSPLKKNDQKHEIRKAKQQQGREWNHNEVRFLV